MSADKKQKSVGLQVEQTNKKQIQKKTKVSKTQPTTITFLGESSLQPHSIYQQLSFTKIM